MLSEFGGIALRANDNTWGYTRAEGIEGFMHAFTRLLSVVRKLEALSGFCYTQLTDTYQEANGLLYADRTPKLPLEVIFRAIAGTELEGQPSVPPIVVGADDE